MQPDKKFLEVYVYLVEMSGGDPWGHVGLILQQKDGTYIRYSQAAKNSNLHGFKIVEYFVSMQPALVRRHLGKSVKGLSAGGKVIRIPTEHAEKIQKAVDKYIAYESNYNIVTNDCADFVNEVLSEAQDIHIVVCPLPKAYFKELERKYPDCVVK
jgi:hypothetical protein